jgi:ABC-type branched-subunit amino acid transport system substrate-binding protein/LysM repeat protein
MTRIFGFILFFSLLRILPVSAQEGNDKLRSKVIREIDGTEYYIHTILKGQSLYKISKIYGVEMDLIISLNPEIREGLKTGATLKIPVNKPVTPEEKQRRAREQAALKTPVPPAELPCGLDPTKKKKVYKVALMMHFFLNDVDSLNLFDLPENPEAAYRPFQFIQFYEGFMMAVDSLKQKGLTAQIYVYDVSTDTDKTRSFLSDPGLKEMDLIFALLYQRNFQIVAGFAKENKIPVVSPVSERDVQVAGNPMVFKVRPSVKTLYPDVAEMISSQYKEARIVIVRPSQGRYRDDADELGKLCLDHGLNSVITDPGGMVDFLQKDVQNLVVIITDSKSAALDLLTQLNGIKAQYLISVFGLPLWSRMDGMEVEYLVNLKTHMAAPYFIDYTDPGVKRFVTLFQEQVRTDPDVLAFAGFDAGYYFLTALMKYGVTFGKCLKEMDVSLLHNKFEFAQTDGNGYENQHWMIYYYENYQVFDAGKP